MNTETGNPLVAISMIREAMRQGPHGYLATEVHLHPKGDILSPQHFYVIIYPRRTQTPDRWTYLARLGKDEAHAGVELFSSTAEVVSSTFAYEKWDRYPSDHEQSGELLDYDVAWDPDDLVDPDTEDFSAIHSGHHKRERPDDLGDEWLLRGVL